MNPQRCCTTTRGRGGAATRGLCIAIVIAGLLGGCGGPKAWFPEGVNTAPNAGPLRAGVGWSDAEQPEKAAAVALADAMASLGGANPALLLVWDNFPDATQAEVMLNVLKLRVPADRIFGGRTDWPVAGRWSASPAVTVMAIAGDIRLTHFAQPCRAGRERELGQAVADGLRAAAGEPAGQVALIFGRSLANPGRFVEGFLSRSAPVGGAAGIIGGDGGGVGGYDRQYVAGRAVSGWLWAVKLAGPLAARAVYLSADASVPDRRQLESSVRQAAAVAAATLLTKPTPTTQPDVSSRPIVLLTFSAGWLGYLDQPTRIVDPSAARLGGGQEELPLVAGWVGQGQLAIVPHDPSASGDSRFGLAALVIEPR